MAYLKNQIEEPMKVFKKENGKWVLVFKGTNWKKGWKVADELSAMGEEVRVD
jgi:hypothetical protein